MQVLNVCRGGTLHQHLPDLVGHGRHDGPPNGFGLHHVRISPDSALAGILTQGPEDGFLDVPTHHHQAVDLLGDGLKAVAWEEDGTIEAVEAGPSELDGFSGFVLGVQWHPEQGSDPRLFTALVRAAMDGTAMDGTAMDGTAMDGTAMDGTAMDGTAMDGTGAERAAAGRGAAGRAAARSTVLAPMI
jgi:gamma-glutamyl-gamma-aminobutyrate hydrolase PuuD